MLDETVDEDEDEYVDDDVVDDGVLTGIGVETLDIDCFCFFTSLLITCSVMSITLVRGSGPIW